MESLQIKFHPSSLNGSCVAIISQTNGNEWMHRNAKIKLQKILVVIAKMIFFLYDQAPLCESLLLQIWLVLLGIDF